MIVHFNLAYKSTFIDIKTSKLDFLTRMLYNAPGGWADGSGLYFLQKAGFLAGWNYFGDVMMPFLFIGLIFGYWNTSRRYL